MPHRRLQHYWHQGHLCTKSECKPILAAFPLNRRCFAPFSPPRQCKNRHRRSSTLRQSLARAAVDSPDILLVAAKTLPQKGSMRKYPNTSSPLWCSSAPLIVGIPFVQDKRRFCFLPEAVLVRWRHRQARHHIRKKHMTSSHFSASSLLRFDLPIFPSSRTPHPPRTRHMSTYAR